ncbi:unnamed protein product [Rotaria sordida]|uniref:RNA-directed DNA polymerase n=1 Tax=Rotaria sordida TaxID=392033 RepID=A0A814JWK3_9BILA|nr:unnamed protein product [Rotaria sordida]CAF1227676.1 unnamed protein product [Rotaria sordida]
MYNRTRQQTPSRQCNSLSNEPIINISIKAIVNGKQLRAMIDTGATHSFITQRALSTLHHAAVPSCDRIAQLGDGHTMLEVIGGVQLLLQFDSVFTPLEVLVVKTMNTDLILGGDWCAQNAVWIDYAKNQVSIRSPTGPLKSGCFQFPIHETDKEETAFITQNGLWEFNVVPQGIMNGPPSFQRTMHNILGYGHWDYVMAYLDDILIVSRTFDEHKQHLNEILSILAKANFQVNPDKYVGIGDILRQDTPHGTKINYFKSRVVNDTERKYDSCEKETLAIYWCINELRSYIGDSNFIVETDHKPLENFHNKQINNKRVMNWLFKLQDILLQILAVKYRKGANNTATDYISRHFSSAAILNTDVSTVSISYDDWLMGSDNWSEKTPKPQRLQFTQSSMSSNSSIRNAAMNVEVNAVTPRAQVKLLAQPLPSPPGILSKQNTSSSSPSSNQLYDFSLSRMHSEQAQGLVIQKLIQQVRNKTCHQPFIIHRDILYKLARRGNTATKLLYSPSKLIPELLAAYHDHHLSGHFGVERTRLALKNIYFWPRMEEIITSYIQSCNQCSKFNVNRRKPPGLLQPIQPPNDVFQILGMNWWGPTIISLDGNRYVLVITDRLSGYVFAKPSPTNTAQDTARILMEEMILVHASPNILLTDQGTHFNNELMNVISNLVGCKHVFSTSYHPQTNGQTERWHATFATHIAKFCNTEHDNWDTFLPPIVYAYNNGIHSSTGFTPYQLGFGRQPRHPFQPPATTFKFTKPHDYRTQLMQYRNTALKQAKNNVLHPQQLTKLRFDKNRSHSTFLPASQQQQALQPFPAHISSISTPPYQPSYAHIPNSFLHQPLPQYASLLLSPPRHPPTSSLVPPNPIVS